MTSRNRQPNDAGFTLIETLVVLAVLGLLLSLVTNTMPTRGRQLDVRAAAGIDFKEDDTSTKGKNYIETMGTGLGWIDYDQDGLLDLYLVQAYLTARRYQEAADLAGAAQASVPEDLRFTALRARAQFLSGARPAALALLEPGGAQNDDKPDITVQVVAERFTFTPSRVTVVTNEQAYLSSTPLVSIPIVMKRLTTK